MCMVGKFLSLTTKKTYYGVRRFRYSPTKVVVGTAMYHTEYSKLNHTNDKISKKLEYSHSGYHICKDFLGLKTNGHAENHYYDNSICTPSFIGIVKASGKVAVYETGYLASDMEILSLYFNPKALDISKLNTILTWANNTGIKLVASTSVLQGAINDFVSLKEKK